MRRTRKPIVVWLPNDGGNSLGAGPTVFKDFVLELQGGIANTVTAVIPLTIDGRADATVDTLADYEGSAYRLRRIVGKCFAATAQDDEPAAGTPSGVLITAGFIVLRTDVAGVPLSGIAAFNNYSPALLDSERDPWIWRRTWALSNNIPRAALVGAQARRAIFPQTNAEYGSLADGPHIDAKTARIVSDEERLFFVCAATALDGAAEGGSLFTSITLDYRLLASMRKQSGNRRNASR